MFYLPSHNLVFIDIQTFSRNFSSRPTVDSVVCCILLQKRHSFNFQTKSEQTLHTLSLSLSYMHLSECGDIHCAPSPSSGAHTKSHSIPDQYTAPPHSSTHTYTHPINSKQIAKTSPILLLLMRLSVMVWMETCVFIHL